MNRPYARSNPSPLNVVPPYSSTGHGAYRRHHSWTLPAGRFHAASPRPAAQAGRPADSGDCCVCRPHGRTATGSGPAGGNPDPAGGRALAFFPAGPVGAALAISLHGSAASALFTRPYPVRQCLAFSRWAAARAAGLRTVGAGRPLLFPADPLDLPTGAGRRGHVPVAAVRSFRPTGQGTQPASAAGAALYPHPAGGGAGATGGQQGQGGRVPPGADCCSGGRRLGEWWRRCCCAWSIVPTASPWL
jgi:hypothetical protein